MWKEVVVVYFRVHSKPGSPVRYSDQLWDRRPWNRGLIHGRTNHFFFYVAPGSFLGPIQPPVKGVPGVAGREADHFHLVPILIMCGTVPPLPHASS
jgi:hypothetical protein